MTVTDARANWCEQMTPAEGGYHPTEEDQESHAVEDLLQVSILQMAVFAFVDLQLASAFEINVTQPYSQPFQEMP